MQAIVHDDQQAQWLVGRFCDHLLARGDSVAKLSSRVDKFYRSAFQGASDHPVTEIAAVVDYLFGVCGGEFPAEMTRDLDAYIPPWRQEELRAMGKEPRPVEQITPRVTNLRQVLHPSHYAQLLELMGRFPTPRRSAEGVVTTPGMSSEGSLVATVYVIPTPDTLTTPAPSVAPQGGLAPEGGLAEDKPAAQPEAIPSPWRSMSTEELLMTSTIKTLPTQIRVGRSSIIEPA